jgi:pimeloyl-ACP methyl ester carboxylesterase
VRTEGGRPRTVAANGLEFTVLEAGTGPLALCLHGFPDSAHTWRHLLPALADRGFHAVAPFMRGYAPTAIPADGCYRIGALIADAVALHEALGGDERAVIVGHDWGAEAAYGAAAFAPERWRRTVALAIPPSPLDLALFGDYGQLRRFFYYFLMATPLAEPVLTADGGAFIDRLWRQWSPGYDGGDEAEAAKRSLADPANLRAAVSYYRAALSELGAEPTGPYEAEQAAVTEVGPQPTLYLHGADDGCIDVALVAAAEGLLPAGSRFEVIPGSGHFLHLERPAEVNDLVARFAAGDGA